MPPVTGSNLRKMFLMGVATLFLIEFFKLTLIIQRYDIVEPIEQNRGVGDVIMANELTRKRTGIKKKGIHRPSDLGDAIGGKEEGTKKEANTLTSDLVLKMMGKVDGRNGEKKLFGKISLAEELKEVKRVLDEDCVKKQKDAGKDAGRSGDSEHPPEKEDSGKQNPEIREGKSQRNNDELGEIFINTSLPVLSHHPFQYIINTPDICKGRKIFLLCYVHTAVNHVKRRKRIRQTWGNATNYPGVEIQVVFFVGLPDLTTNEGLLYRDYLKFESEHHGDIVQENFLDTYHNLSHKGVGALKWVATYCNHSDYVLKTDDDMFVNMYIILNHLRNLYAENFTKRLMMCYVFWLMHVDRKGGPWSLTKEYFPDDLYPPYCSGMGFVLSTDVAIGMYRVSPYVRFLWVDDAFISGVLPAGLRGAVNHTSWARTYCAAYEMGVYVHPTEWYKYTFSHVHNEAQYMSTWQGLSEIAKNRTIPRPGVIRPGHLADEYIPLRQLFPLQ